ncbi:hypothetical protein NDU88_000035 [Pleurodeles waltl]|uniref:Uncharacterized protein n=1 Tax=Pleurodeles waltl TaxID=8319 RepID=A0AAV7U401_PLEWA|nr:hypothetical protein NDU88_000035 [Pleurodeles waltl]
MMAPGGSSSMLASSAWWWGAGFRCVSARVPGPKAKRCPAVLPTGHWAGPVFGSMWLGRLQAEDAPGCGLLFLPLPSTVPVDVPIYPCIQEVIKRELRDPDKIFLPRFMAKMYPLQEMAQVLPDSVPVDSFVACLVGHT